MGADSFSLAGKAKNQISFFRFAQKGKEPDLILSICPEKQRTTAHSFDLPRKAKNHGSFFRFAQKSKEPAAILPPRPAQAYTATDLDWNDPQSRTSLEMNQANNRPELAADSQLPDLAQHQMIWLGFPIWWGEAPRIINRFLESVTLGDQQLVLFATSGSSGIDKAANRLQGYFKDDQVIGKRRLASQTSLKEISDWIQSLGIEI